VKKFLHCAAIGAEAAFYDLTAHLPKEESCMKSKTTIVALTLFLFAVPIQWASAQSESHGSQGSGAISAGSGEIIAGSLDIIASGSELVVTSVERIGESTVIVAKGASAAGAESVKLSISAVAGASLAVGAVLQVVAYSTGYSLMAAGQVLAFIPNEVGRSLLHRQRVEERRL